jgi:hypothetical protein
MKTKRNIRAVVLFIGMAAGLMITSSCLKKANVYAPKKPIQPVNGFYSSDAVDAANLVAYWPFSGDLTDSLSKTAGVATGTSFGTGVEGKGLQGANNGYVVTNVPAAVQAVHSFTVTTWVNMPENVNGAVGILDIANTQNFWGNLDIFFDNGATATTGVLKVHVWNKSGSSTGSDAWEGGYTVTNPWSNWIHIAVTYNDETSTVTVYYNGAVAGTNTATGFAPLDWSQAKQMVFGTLQFQTNPSLTSNTGSQSWASFMTGVMDQVRIYNTALSTNDIGAIYGLEKLGR